MKLKNYQSLFVFMLAVLFIASQAATAQKVDEFNVDQFRGYLMFGGTQLDIDDLNSSLTANGYTPFSDEFASIGIGFHVKTNSRWLFGAEGNVVFTESQKNDLEYGTYQTILTTGYGFFDVGYIVASMGELDIYPLVGIGFGGQRLDIGKNSFDQILQEPQGNAYITQGNLLLNFAVGSDYVLKEKGEKGGLLLGFRLGYTYAPFDGVWMTNTLQTEGGPGTGMTGPYLRLSIGFAGSDNFLDAD